ncbi:MAG: hypothetical protein K6E40_01160 [Desulfovibrio sp.]|nr:hypothetical protein [Desulfovibrio sp.]
MADGEVYCLKKGDDGFSRILRMADDKAVTGLHADGEGMGSLWRDRLFGWLTGQTA